MSYTIWKSIKQNKNGNFDIECAESNVYTYDNKRAWNKYTDVELVKMKNRDLALPYLILSSIYNGDVFYQSTLKAKQKLANKFFMENNINWYDVDKNDDIEKVCKAFLLYSSRRVSKNKYYVKIQNKYVARKTKSKIFFTYYGDENGAKVFTAESEQELLDSLAGYKNYGIELIKL